MNSVRYFTNFENSSRFRIPQLRLSEFLDVVEMCFVTTVIGRLHMQAPGATPCYVPQALQDLVVWQHGKEVPVSNAKSFDVDARLLHSVLHLASTFHHMEWNRERSTRLYPGMPAAEFNKASEPSRALAIAERRILLLVMLTWLNIHLFHKQAMNGSALATLYSRTNHWLEKELVKRRSLEDQAIPAQNIFKTDPNSVLVTASMPEIAQAASYLLFMQDDELVNLEDAIKRGASVTIDPSAAKTDIPPRLGDGIGFDPSATTIHRAALFFSVSIVGELTPPSAVQVWKQHAFSGMRRSKSSNATVPMQSNVMTLPSTFNVDIDRGDVNGKRRRWMVCTPSIRKGTRSSTINPGRFANIVMRRFTTGLSTGLKAHIGKFPCRSRHIFAQRTKRTLSRC